MLVQLHKFTLTKYVKPCCFNFRIDQLKIEEFLRFLRLNGLKIMGRGTRNCGESIYYNEINIPVPPNVNQVEKELLRDYGQPALAGH